jgi:hypothetical protein
LEVVGYGEEKVVGALSVSNIALTRQAALSRADRNYHRQCRHLDHFVMLALQE